MKILITGGAGFIGAHLAAALLRRGEQVTLFDDFNDVLYSSALKRARVKNLLSDKSNLVTGSITRSADLDQVMIGQKFDLVVHLAAHANPGASVNQADVYTNNNVLGTLRVLEAMARHKISRLIFASSSSVYNDEQTPFKEDAYPLLPKSPYSASKAAGELYCYWWQHMHKTSVTVLRFFSVYGPWGRPDMAPYIFSAAIIKGREIKVTKEERRRDFTYIDDIIDGLLLAVDKELDFEIINLGRGEPTLLTDFIAGIEAAAGVKAHVKNRPAPPGEMRVTYADISKARRLLGYHPQVAVSAGTARLVEWMRHQITP